MYIGEGMSHAIENIRADPVTAAIFEALATGEKCLCELKEALGIPQSWELYDLRMLEDLEAVQSRTENGWKYYTLGKSRALWHLRRALLREEPESPRARLPVRYDSAREQIRGSVPGFSQAEATLRRGF